MIRKYCDVCDKEIVRNFVHTRLAGTAVKHPNRGDKAVRVNIEVMAGIGPGTMNGGDICLPCLLDCVNIVGGNEAR